MEVILGDSGYQGLKQVGCPFKGNINDPRQAGFNLALDRRKAIVENVNARLKAFAALRTPWRHDIGKHRTVFRVLAKIINIDLKYHPLRIDNDVQLSN